MRFARIGCAVGDVVGVKEPGWFFDDDVKADLGTNGKQVAVGNKSADERGEFR